MGSYKYGYKSLNMGYTLLIAPLKTTHEAPSKIVRLKSGSYCDLSQGAWPRLAESMRNPNHSGSGGRV